MSLSPSQLQQINLHTPRFMLDLFPGPFQYTMSVILGAVPREERESPGSVSVGDRVYFLP